MFPNKVVAIKESILWYFPDILEHLLNEDLEVEELWQKVKKNIKDINVFILILDALFVLGKLEYCERYGVIKYVKAN